MAKGLARLSITDCRNAETGDHTDGGGLILRVSKNNGKSWVYRFRLNGKRPEFGLGSFPAVMPAEARRRHAAAMQLVARGVNPIEQKAKAKPLKFGEFATSQAKIITATSTSEKYKAQWIKAVFDHCQPIWDLPIDKITSQNIVSCLGQWRQKRETLKRVRRRIERILDAATAKGLRSGDNPARWAIIQHMISDLSPLERRHTPHPALEYQKMPEFWQALQCIDKPVSLALQILILCGNRTGEIRGKLWSEIDLDNALWSVPAVRMKTKRLHVIPLSKAAMEILTNLPRDGDLIFPTLTPDSMLDLIKSMGDVATNKEGKRVTTHGFRSTFRDWAGDQTNFDQETMEMSLSHVIGGVEGAYRRGIAIEKRRRLLESWSDYCHGKESDKIISLYG